LIRLFCKEAACLGQDLEQAIKREEFDSIVNICIDIRSMAQNVAGKAVISCLEKLIVAAKEGNTAMLEVHLANFHSKKNELLILFTRKFPDIDSFIRSDEDSVDIKP